MVHERIIYRSSESDTKRAEEVEALFLDFLESEKFKTEVINYTKHTIHDVLSFLVKIASPLILIIISLCVYVFSTTNTNIEKLTSSVEGLQKTTASFNSSISVYSKAMEIVDERSRENKNQIDELIKKSYEK